MNVFRTAATACALVAAGLVLAALPATSALASTGTTVGQTGPPTAIVAWADGVEVAQTSAAMPAGGVVTGFQTQAGACPVIGGIGGSSSSGGVYDFQVLHPLPGGQYRVLGDTGDLTDPCDGALHTYTLSTPISVQAGDVLGVYVSSYWQGVLDEYGTTNDAFISEPAVGDTITLGSFKAPAAAIDESATLETASEVAAATLVSDADSVAPGTALFDKATAIQAEANANPPQTATACAGITDFLGLVQAQTGKKLTPAHAALLTTDAGNLAAALGC